MIFASHRILVLLFLLLCSYGIKAERCINVVTAGGGSDYWKDVEQGAMLAASEIDVPLFIRGASEENNTTGQAMILDGFEKKKCFGLVLAPNTLERAEYTERLIAKHGVPTVFIDRDVGGARVSVIKTDNFEAGYTAAQKLLESHGELGKVVIFHPGKDVPVTWERVMGFTKALDVAGIKIAKIIDVGTTIGESRTKIKEALRSLDANVFFTPNQSTTLALLISLESSGRSPPVVHVGFDPNSMIEKAIAEGRMFGAIKQNPFLMGYLGVRTVYEAHLGGRVVEKIDVPVIFIEGVQNPVYREAR